MLKNEVSGIFFDINPAHRRNLFNSPCHHFVRLSFGPPLEDLEKGTQSCWSGNMTMCSLRGTEFHIFRAYADDVIDWQVLMLSSVSSRRQRRRARHHSVRACVCLYCLSPCSECRWLPSHCIVAPANGPRCIFGATRADAQFIASLARGI